MIGGCSGLGAGVFLRLAGFATGGLTMGFFAMGALALLFAGFADVTLLAGARLGEAFAFGAGFATGLAALALGRFSVRFRVLGLGRASHAAVRR
jgi:hypothetical protein